VRPQQFGTLQAVEEFRLGNDWGQAHFTELNLYADLWFWQCRQTGLLINEIKAEQA
jgi:hypothetical protein